MRRRDLLRAPLALPALCGAAPGPAEKPKEWVTAAASRDTAPRVGLIVSSFTGGEEMDGKKLRALHSPAPVTAPLTAAQLDDMLRLAVELGGGRRGGLATSVAPEDWVVIKTSVASVPGGAEPYLPGSATDLRLVRSVLACLVEGRRGRRFTIAAGADFPAGDSLWSSTWNGEFDGLSYRSIVAEFAARHRSLRFELLDLNQDEVLEMPVDGWVSASKNPGGVYSIARTLRHCDKVISIAPLQTHAATGVALSMMNYLGFASGKQYGLPRTGLGKLGDAGEVALDLFSFHPVDYAILGGSFAIEGDGPAGAGALGRRHNVVIAGSQGLAVDAVGAAVMGFHSSAIRHLHLAVRRGYGSDDADSIWTRGNEIPDARAEFRKPRGWAGKTTS